MPHLKTTNVFIDTQVFDAQNLNFESTVFKELSRLARDGRVKVFLTTVTESEILAHIPQQIHEAFLALEKFRNKGRPLKNVTAFKPAFADFDEQAAVAEVRKKFETFLINADVTVLGLEDADAEAIFKDYFEKRPPFGEGKKKHEFPDAFGQQSLTKWCEDNDCQMYVVSADYDWQSLEGRSKCLIPIGTVQEFIDSAVKDEAEELTKTVLRLYRQNLPKVSAAIKAAFKDCGFYTDDVDGDVNEVIVTRLELGEPRILEVEDVSATISVSVELDYTANISYYDDDEGIWDSEDDKWMYRPTKHGHVDESERFEGEVFIQFDPDNAESFDVSCSISREFSVTVFPTDYELK